MTLLEFARQGGLGPYASPEEAVEAYYKANPLHRGIPEDDLVKALTGNAPPAPAQETNEKPNLFERVFSPAGEAAVANAKAVQELPQTAGGVIKDTVQDIGQGISDQFNFNQAQRNKETGAIPAPKESDYRPQITEEDGEKKITFSEGLFTRFMKDYSSMMITEYAKQPRTGQDPGPDPLYDMIRGKQGG